MTMLFDEDIDNLRQFAENRLLSRDITQYEADLIQRLIVALTRQDVRMMSIRAAKDAEIRRLAADVEYMKGMLERRRKGWWWTILRIFIDVW